MRSRVISFLRWPKRGATRPSWRMEQRGARRWQEARSCCPLLEEKMPDAMFYLTNCYLMCVCVCVVILRGHAFSMTNRVFSGSNPLTGGERGSWRSSCVLAVHSRVLPYRQAAGGITANLALGAWKKGYNESELTSVLAPMSTLLRQSWLRICPCEQTPLLASQARWIRNNLRLEEVKKVKAAMVWWWKFISSWLNKYLRFSFNVRALPACKGADVRTRWIVSNSQNTVFFL